MRMTKVFRLFPVLLPLHNRLTVFRVLQSAGCGFRAAIAFAFAVFIAHPVVALSQTPGNDIETLFREGQAALRQGEFDRAQRAFQQVLVQDPTLVEAEVNLGLAYQGQLDYAAAAHHLSRALRQRPNLLGPNVITGLDYLKLGSPETAVPYLRRALELDPSSQDAHDAMAVYELARENFEGAAKQYREVAKLDPVQTDALFTLGHEYLDLAVRLAYRGARLYPQSAWGHRFLGDMLFEREGWEEAGKEYSKALALDPRQVGLHTMLGEVALHSGKLQDAEGEFRAELQMDPHYERAWLGLANLQLAAGNATEALASVNQVWQNSPEFFVSHPAFPALQIAGDPARSGIASLQDQPEGPAKQFLLAALYSAANQPLLGDRAMESFQNSVPKAPFSSAGKEPHDGAASCRLHRYSDCIAWLQKTKPLTSSDYLTLGKAYFVLRQLDLAANMLAKVQGDNEANSQASYWLEKTYQAAGAQSFLEVEESDPDSWRTHQLKAEGFALRGDENNATKEYETAIQLAPDKAELYEALGEFELNSRLDEEAQKTLEKAVALDPARTHTLYSLGRLYVLDHENQKAIPILSRALKLQPNLEEACALLGDALVREGQYAQAVVVLEKAAPIDHYGDVHYQLATAYRNLGKPDLAKKAFELSQEIRRRTLEMDQARIMGPRRVEPDPQ
jgi:tetratricopeptide (TPR) repeat protein